MSFTIHPFCENGNNVPQNCVHAGPVSLGLLRKDYKADTAQLWRAGINPSTNLLVASTTFSRGLVGSAATSTPRYWWIAGPRNDQASLETKVKEVRAPVDSPADDAFAERLGIENLEKLKELIKGNLEGQYADASRFKLKRALLDVLDSKHDFPLPPKMVEAEFASIWDQVTFNFAKNCFVFNLIDLLITSKRFHEIFSHDQLPLFAIKSKDL
jgi:hypothetical protein